MSAPSWKSQYSRALRYHLRDFPNEQVDDFVEQIEAHIDDSVDAFFDQRRIATRQQTPKRPRHRNVVGSPYEHTNYDAWEIAKAERHVVKHLRPAKRMAVDFHNAQLTKHTRAEPVVLDVVTMASAMVLFSLHFPQLWLSMIAHIGAVLALEAAVISAVVRRVPFGKRTGDVISLLPWTRAALSFSSAGAVTAGVGTAIIDLQAHLSSSHGLYFSGHIANVWPMIAAIATAITLGIQPRLLERLQNRLTYFVAQLEHSDSLASEDGGIDNALDEVGFD